ncbi:cyclic GMP-AMP synthase [Engraulis encrasicolus]|uniref:cyclic GMP-AMP synthase n=1 Tax=Engraulis encrasicolus TaxID=184585 RepID=UPI002FD6072D
MASRGKASSDRRSSTKTHSSVGKTNPCRPTGGRAATGTQNQRQAQVPTPSSTANCTPRPGAKSLGKEAPAQPPRQRRPLDRDAAVESPQRLNKPTRGGSIEDDPSKVLRKTLDQLTIRKQPRSRAAKIKNDVVEKIIDQLEKSRNFSGIKILPTGSYFENLKISNPDEFDVMFTIPVDRVEAVPFGEDGAYYSVKFKRHPKQHVLDPFLQANDVLCASDMLAAFRKEIKEALKTIPIKGLKMEPKKPTSPAVTLILQEDGREISIDLVLGLEVKGSWPQAAQAGMNMEKWLGTKVKRDFKFKPYYLVPKHEGRGSTESDGVSAKDVWRISFSHVEKAIMKNHGAHKSCCEKGGEKCCRKQCLKLLKHLLAELKAKHPTELSKFCSYYAKTTLLHVCSTKYCKDDQWQMSDLLQCFERLLEDFQQRLRSKLLPNFFVPAHNLLASVSAKSCNALASYIETEHNNGFPIFKNGLVKG